MPGYSLVPVDYQPDFEGVSLVPVDYDPFAADGPIQQAATQPARPAATARFRSAAVRSANAAVRAAAPANAPTASALRSATAGTRSTRAISGLAADARRPQRDAGDGVSGTTPNPVAQALAGRQQPGQTSDPHRRVASAARLNRRRHRLNQRSHSRKASRNSLRREPASPASTGRRPATAPADRVAALASNALAATKVATFRAAMRGSVSRARTAHGMLPSRK